MDLGLHQDAWLIDDATSELLPKSHQMKLVEEMKT
jgi:hypothetical protein